MNRILEGISSDLKAVPEGLKAKMDGVDRKKVLLMAVPYILAGYFFDKIAWLWRVTAGGSTPDRVVLFMDRLDRLFANPLPSFHPWDLLAGVCCGIALRLLVYLKARNAKKFRHGMEYGSAR